MQFIRNLPLIVILQGIGAILMLLPSLHATLTKNHEIARHFFYYSLLFIAITGFLALATNGRKPKSFARSHLLALLATFSVLPMMLAVPLLQSIPELGFFNAYFEMLSSLTTTGASVIENPREIVESLHLWRSIVGWFGGFFMWVVAIAILAPLRLGGFEVVMGDTNSNQVSDRQIAMKTEAADRLARYTLDLFPLYVALTGFLWLLLVFTGNSPFDALTISMGTLSTSAILPNAQAGNFTVYTELAIFVFFVFALSRQTFSMDRGRYGMSALRGNIELRLAITLILATSVALFIRHYVGAAEEDSVDDLRGALRAFWGGLFTVTSFLTTTGFEGSDWVQVRYWSGLQTPGMILMGLALMGGGVATTAGGVKLLRISALYFHSRRELQKLVYPSSVAAGSGKKQTLMQRGAYISWIFFMLFALTLALVILALAETGQGFEAAIVLAISALTSTGPLALVAAELPIDYALLPDNAKAVLMVAMVLGRLETLAIVALFNPEFWRM